MRKQPLIVEVYEIRDNFGETKIKPAEFISKWQFEISIKHNHYDDFILLIFFFNPFS